MLRKRKKKYFHSIMMVSVMWGSEHLRIPSCSLQDQERSWLFSQDEDCIFFWCLCHFSLILMPVTVQIRVNRITCCDCHDLISFPASCKNEQGQNPSGQKMSQWLLIHYWAEKCLIQPLLGCHTCLILNSPESVFDMSKLIIKVWLVRSSSPGLNMSEHND